MDTFGDSQAKVIPLDLSENQFQIYNKISRKTIKILRYHKFNRIKATSRRIKYVRINTY